MANTSDAGYVRWFETLGSADVALVGGKNASLGEMIQRLGDRGIRVPGGFATTAAAYRAFIDANELWEPLRALLVINGSLGLGENVVKGTVIPDEYVVFKPLLDREDLVPIVGKVLGTKEHKLVYAVERQSSRRSSRSVSTAFRSAATT